MMTETYTVKVEEGRPPTEGIPSAGPVYRCIYAKDGLLDLPKALVSPWDFFRNAAQKNPKNQMLGRREKIDGKGGPYTWQTYQEAYDEAVRIGSAMRNRGVNPGGRCGIYGSNTSEWIIAMEACNSQAISYVPLYDSLGPNAVEFIINHAEVSIAFVQDTKLSSILSCLPKCNSYLKTIVSFSGATDSQKKQAEEHGASCFSWDEFLQTGSTDCELPPKHETDITTIMYTSGTTGEPKGVILTSGAIIAEVLAVDKLLRDTDKEASEEDSYFSFLPLAHVFDQIIETYCIYKGASIGFWQGDVRYLIDDIQEFKPTIFCGVPRVYERIYMGMNHKITAGGKLRKTLFDYAYSYKLGNLEKGLLQHEAAPRLDKLIFDKIKLGLGGRVRVLLSGAAPLPRHVEEFFRVTSCSIVSQGYGLTESCGGCFTSIANVWSQVGTVGVPNSTIEARLESVPQMGYDALSDVPRGEICIRGKSLFSGYHKRQDLTDEVFVDGWFHTGDIGEWQPDGSMRIIDRKKNIFKLSQGEYVSVETIEGAYSQCPLISSIWVYGNSFESFLVAVAVPERAPLEEWARNNDLTGDFKSLCENPVAKKHILDALNATGQKHKLRGFEMLKAIHLDPRPFDMERDLITPTFKLKRPQLLKHYKEQINALYKDFKATNASFKY